MSTTDKDSDFPPPSQSPPKTTPTTFSPQKQADSLLEEDDTRGAGASIVAYDKASLTKTLQELELNLAQSRILPLIPPFMAELANNISLEPLDIQFLLEFQTKWPLTFFEKTDQLRVQEEKTSSTFIYFGGQIFFVTHQLSAFLFDIEADFGHTPKSTIDLSLIQFHNALRRYPQTFLVYRGKEFRINLSHVNKLITHMSDNKLQPNKLIFAYLVFIFSFFKDIDKDFKLGRDLALVFSGLLNHINRSLGWTYNLYKSMLYSQNIHNAFQYIQDNDLEFLFVNTITHPYKAVGLELKSIKPYLEVDFVLDCTNPEIIDLESESTYKSNKHVAPGLVQSIVANTLDLDKTRQNLPSSRNRVTFGDSVLTSETNVPNKTVPQGTDIGT